MPITAVGEVLHLFFAILPALEGGNSRCPAVGCLGCLRPAKVPSRRAKLVAIGVRTLLAGRDPKPREERQLEESSLKSDASAYLWPMTLSEFLLLIALLFPGILLSLILMATFAAGG
jgi:hypothetical protein